MEGRQRWEEAKRENLCPKVGKLAPDFDFRFKGIKATAAVIINYRLTYKMRPTIRTTSVYN